MTENRIRLLKIRRALITFRQTGILTSLANSKTLREIFILRNTTALRGRVEVRDVSDVPVFRNDDGRVRLCIRNFTVAARSTRNDDPSACATTYRTESIWLSSPYHSSRLSAARAFRSKSNRTDRHRRPAMIVQPRRI